MPQQLSHVQTDTYPPLPARSGDNAPQTSHPILRRSHRLNAPVNLPYFRHPRILLSSLVPFLSAILPGLSFLLLLLGLLAAVAVVPPIFLLSDVGGRVRRRLREPRRRS